MTMKCASFKWNHGIRVKDLGAAMGVSFKQLALTNMLWLANFLWFLASAFLVHLLCLIFPRFSRVSSQGSRISGVGGDEVGDTPADRNRPKICGLESDSLGVSSAITSKYEFLGGNSFCGYIEDPQTTSFKVQELFFNSGFEDRKPEESVAEEEEFDVKTGASVEVSACTGDPSSGSNFRKVDDHVETDSTVADDESSLDELKTGVVVCDEMSMDEDFRQDDKGEIECCNENRKLEESVATDEELDAKTWGSVEVFASTDDPSPGSDFREVDDQLEIDSPVGDESSLDDEPKTGVVVRDGPSLDVDFGQDDKGEIESSSESGEIGFEDNGLMSEPPRGSHLTFSFDHVSHEPIIPINDFWHTNGKFIADVDGFYGYPSAGEEVLAPETPMSLDTKSVDPYEEDISASDSADSCDDDNDHHQGSLINHTKAEEEEDDEMEEGRNRVPDEDHKMDNDVLLEHQSYVQMMKKEMKHLRTRVLPTIWEDSESPRMDVDLKPLKIDDKPGYKDRLDEIPMFYKTYLDKMRRLDILCHQTMYAFGILQLKNPDQLAANKKASIPSIKSLLAHNLLPNKFRRQGSDSVQKLIRDLQRDLELVYVGQLCLSWEILKWQHAKAEELQLFDTIGLHQYSVAAGEFQQFRVLMQRFTEDEQFQGPRVENYVKSRCANCSLLQVPPIKEDSKNAKDRHAVVSIVRLMDIIEESMHSFWEFIRTDKKESGAVVVGDPLDAELLSDIRTNLAKKERRIKDLVRSRNCIIKKFQKQPDCQLTHELLLGLVELKLVARVIGMSGVTADQLLWCHKKLGKISIVGRKVHIESSFAHFPC